MNMTGGGRFRELFFSPLSVTAWAIIVLVASIVPFGSGGAGHMPGLDKVFHFLAYAILSSLVCGTLFLRTASGKVKILLFTLITCVVYGILIELLQKSFPPREAELADVFFNFTGASAGVMTTKYLLWPR
jgi:VanZ family protein